MGRIENVVTPSESLNFSLQSARFHPPSISNRLEAKGEDSAARHRGRLVAVSRLIFQKLALGLYGSYRKCNYTIGKLELFPTIGSLSPTIYFERFGS